MVQKGRQDAPPARNVHPPLSTVDPARRPFDGAWASRFAT